jgi:hypothetical protein
LDFKKEAVDETSTRNTARVIQAINADILVVVEAEHRTSLHRFNQEILGPTTGMTYDHVMLIDGNDPRGIDVGVLFKNNCVLDFMRSHVDDRFNNAPIFSRDCPEYHFKLPSGETLLVIVIK